jgi:hypothetical protein
MNVRGSHVVVLDRGFVYQGNVTIIGDEVTISNAFNIRVWGTTNGLGELALYGPQKGTILDSCGIVVANLASVNHFLVTHASLWPEPEDVPTI